MAYLWRASNHHSLPTNRTNYKNKFFGTPWMIIVLGYLFGWYALILIAATLGRPIHPWQTGDQNLVPPQRRPRRLPAVGRPDSSKRLPRLQKPESKSCGRPAKKRLLINQSSAGRFAWHRTSFDHASEGSSKVVVSGALGSETKGRALAENIPPHLRPAAPRRLGLPRLYCRARGLSWKIR